ncbi:MAG TPA: hypothetical protein GX520_00030 [Syntrophaceticus sp.]|nr:hypothetical protein [Syntrophaceticus sp.]
MLEEHSAGACGKRLKGVFCVCSKRAKQVDLIYSRRHKGRRSGLQNILRKIECLKEGESQKRENNLTKLLKVSEINKGCFDLYLNVEANTDGATPQGTGWC